MNDNNTMLSRSGNTSGDGKKNARIDVPVSEELEAEVITMATLDGIPKAEWVRRLIEEALHGKLGMTRRLRRSGIPGQSDESGRFIP